MTKYDAEWCRLKIIELDVKVNFVIDTLLEFLKEKYGVKKK